MRISVWGTTSGGLVSHELQGPLRGSAIHFERLLFVHHNPQLYLMSERQRHIPVISTSYKLFYSCVHTFCVEISGHGIECRTSEMSKLAPLQPITYDISNDTLNPRYFKMIFFRHLRWPIVYRPVARSCW